jgi:hypothetical protein
MLAMRRKTWVATAMACGLLTVAAPAFAADTTAVSTTTITPSIGTPTSLVNTTQPTVLGTVVSNEPLAHTGRATGGELAFALTIAACGGALCVVSRRARRLDARRAD